MDKNIIYTEDCLVTMKDHIDEKSVDIVLTSPPYCTCNRAGKNSKNNLTNETHSNSKFYPTMRYDVFNDNMSEEEYIDWTVKLFESFDRILKKDGCILYNISYSSTRRDMLFLTIAAVLQRTNFSLADMIIWKKRTALPNNTSPNKLTRIIEPVFVFARRDDMETFNCNKKVVSVRARTGQKMYENIHNFIDAANNDGVCKLNRATYSSELCEKLLGIYGKAGMVVYDPFMGTGTTAVACKRLGMSYIGSELSPGQTEFANNRIENDSGIPGSYVSENDLNETTEGDEREVEAQPSEEPKPPKRSPRSRTKDVVNVTRPFTQMRLMDDNDNPSDEFNTFISETKSVSAIDESELEEEPSVDESEFGDFEPSTETNSTETNDNNENGNEEKDDIISKQKAEKEGYTLNGYFHSYSTCPVGEDEF